MTSELRETLSEALGSGFRVLRELSGGGMSRIFLAEELALDREVVVKVLAPELVGESNLERFRYEILQTARLQHPSIVPLLMVGTVQYPTGAQGPYYIMPYIRGETLRSRLQREGAFSTGATIRVLRDVLEALVHAHHHGVVHRDIKPENVFVSGGRAVVADFGVAKAISAGSGSGVATLPGLVVGTPVYMAPEQALGEPGVDHRADLYSLGVVAYELLAGRTPFAGKSTRQVLAALARADPEPLDQIRPGLPLELSHLVMRCLEREPADRWQTAEAVLRQLDLVHVSDPGLRLTSEITVARGQRRIGWAVALTLAAVGAGLVMSRSTVYVPPVPPAIASGLVVLSPVLTGDTTGLSVLAGSLRMELNHDLQHRGLTVLEPLAAEAVFGAGDFGTVADSLNARYLVQSSLLQVGDEVRISVSLDDYRSSMKVLWLARFSLGRAEAGALDSALRVITGTIVDSVIAALATAGEGSAKAAMARAEAPPERPPRERHPEVAAMLAEAEKAMRLRRRDGLLRAVDGYRRALALAPEDPGPHAGLASAYALLLVYAYRSDMDPNEVASLSLAHADRAVELDPTSDEGLVARAYLLNLVNAPTEVVRRDFERALLLNPSSQPGWYSLLLTREGKQDSALREAARGVALDPMSPGRRIAVGWDAIGLRLDAMAVAAAESALRLDPDLPLARGLLARALLAAGHLDRCVRVEVGPYTGTRAACLHRLGRVEAARAVAESLLSRFRLAREDSVFDSSLYAQELAIYFAALGEGEAAIIWVREAFARNPVGIPWPFLRSRLFDRVRRLTQLDHEIAVLEQVHFAHIRADAARQIALMARGTVIPPHP